MQRFKALGGYINYANQPTMPAVWLEKMFHAASKKAEEAIKKLDEEYEDTVTFRGHPYLQLMEKQTAVIEEKGLVNLHPVTYVGNPFLRRTGALLVNP